MGDSSLLAAFGAVWVVVYLAVLVFMVATYWVLFTKAGKPGWASLIPFYNIIVMLEIGGKPAWWIILLLVPFLNIVIGIMALAAFLKAYGRGGAGSVLLALFFPIIYLPYLAFSSNVRYEGISA